MPEAFRVRASLPKTPVSVIALVFTEALVVPSYTLVVEPEPAKANGAGVMEPVKLVKFEIL